MKRRNKGTAKPVFFIIAILIVAVTYISFFGIDNYYGDTRTVYVKSASDIRWGIDISGGVEAIFMPDIQVDKITNEDMASAKEIIETRLVNHGITESEVRTDVNNKQVIVRIPRQSNDKNFDPATAVK